MIITEELLMAYADGELDGPEHAADRGRIEAAMRADPEVARRIESHRALRSELSATFDRVLDEAVPERLIATVRSATSPAAGRGEPRGDGVEVRAGDGASTVEITTGASAARALEASADAHAAQVAPPGAASVSDLSAARVARAEASERAAKARVSWGVPQWAAIAASLVVGAVIGHIALKSPELGPIASRNGHLVAQDHLADALSNQLASTQAPTAPVQIGTSFKSKDGTYCRTFVLHEANAVGGLACRAGDEWNVNTLASTEAAAGANGGYRPAGSELPPAVLSAVEAQIVGDPLDSSAEVHAKNNGWK